jgi:hypothetical protein
MTLPPHGSQHYELRRRIAGCRERLRKVRTAQREEEQAARPQGAAEESAGEPGAGGEEDGARRRKLNSSPRPGGR